MSRNIENCYCEETIAEELVDWLSRGQTLRAFCRQEGKPTWRTIYDWMAADSKFAARIARARDIGHDAIAEQALAIADTPEDGVTVTTEEDGRIKTVKTVKADMLGHRKLQVWTRLQLLAKWNPKRYGEKTTTELTGPGGGPLTTITVDTSDPVEAGRQYLRIIGNERSS